MLSVHSTNQSSLLPPHSFANDAVWRLISRNIGKKCTTPCFFTEEFCFASANSPCLPMPRPSISWCVANLFSMPLTQRSESENPGFPAPYTVWKVSQDTICHVSEVTDLFIDYEQYHMSSCLQSKLLLPVLINHDSPNCSQSQDPSSLGVALRRSVKCFLSPPRREGCA